MRGAIQAVTVVAAGLLLLLSFNYFEPLRLSPKGYREQSASSFSVATQSSEPPLERARHPENDAGGRGAQPGVVQATPAILRLEAAMRRAIIAEDFDEAKRLKLLLDPLRQTKSAREPRLPPLNARGGAADGALPAAASSSTSSSAPAAALAKGPPRLLPILRTATEHPTEPATEMAAMAAEPGTLPGCLIAAWESVWIVHRNGSRSFLPEAPAACKGRASVTEVSMIPKNEGPGREYELKGEALTAAACRNKGCPSGPAQAASGAANQLPPQDAACVLGALSAEPAAVTGQRHAQEAGDFALSKELIAKYASPAGQIIVTFVNSHYLGFAISWVHHLRAVGCDHFLVGGMDDNVLVELQRRQIQAFSIASGGVAARDLGWGSPAFKKAQQVKVQMFADVLALGFDALLADIDAIFVRDPLPYLRCFPEADMLVSSDHLHNSTVDGGLELPNSAHATMNVGILYVRARPGPISFLKEWARKCSERMDFWEQAIFNEMAKDAGGLDVANATLRPHRLFSFWERKLVCGILPVSLYCSGHTGFVQRMHATLGFNAPFALHATFQYSGTRGKTARFREAGLWIDPPAYYAPSGGLLRYQPVLADELTRAPWRGVVDTERHLALVATQMAAVRDALALAQALNRTLLMPSLVCGYDRYWAGMPEGKIPGSALQLPIWHCPIDHLFELERFPPPESIFRESSLLENPRTPRSVTGSVSRVALPALAEGGGGGRQQLDAALVLAGADLSASVLDMSAVPHYTQTVPKSQRRAFEILVMRMPAAFCCNPKGQPPIQYRMPLGTVDDRVGPLPRAPAWKQQ